MDRREFIKNVGALSGGAVLLSSPWLSSFAQTKETVGERLRVGVIGPGSRGRFLTSFLVQNPKVELAAFADIYQPSLDKALELAPKAKCYKDYRDLLNDKSIEAVVIATPLYLHHEHAMAALDAGKQVYCEKSMGMDIQQCYDIYQKHVSTGNVLFVGQQRLFDPRYIRAMEMIHSGMFGSVQAIRSYWFRNGSWRREVPSPELERHINWRMYDEYSRGLMTELACHQLHTGMWAMQDIPNKVMGSGAITYWKDGREVFDNVSLIYDFDNGVKMSYTSVISNKFYGLEEQILGNKGTVEPEKGKFYFEEVEAAPAFKQLLSEIENNLFEAIPFAGTSWAAETAKANVGEYILGETPKTDGTDLALAAFVEASITKKQPAKIAEEGYYASALSLLGHEAITQERMLVFPDEYKLDYLNHKAPIL